MSEKIFYTMGEVSEMFDLPASTFRFWEENFPSLRPKRNKKGNRLYTPDDVETLKKIYHLVKERGLKIEAAKKQLRTNNTPDFERDVELVERLRHIRSMLQDIKDELKEQEVSGDDRSSSVVEEPVAEDTAIEVAVHAEVVIEETLSEAEQDMKFEEVLEAVINKGKPLPPPEPTAVEQLLF